MQVEKKASNLPFILMLLGIPLLAISFLYLYAVEQRSRPLPEKNIAFIAAIMASAMLFGGLIIGVWQTATDSYDRMVRVVAGIGAMLIWGFVLCWVYLTLPR